MSLAEPLWLLLLIPAGLLWWRWPAPTRLLRALRLALLLLLVAGLAGPALRLPDRAGTVVVVADRSRSMPDRARAAQREAIELIQGQMGARDRLGVVAFGERVAVERPPDVGPFGGFAQDVGADASRLGRALERAVALIPEGAPGRVLVLSDGRWTGERPRTAAGRAASRGVSLDYRHQARPRAGDVAVERIRAPVRVDAGESFMIHAWLRAPTARRLRLRLTRGETVIARGRRRVDAGTTRVTFRDTADAAGTRRYRLRVTAPSREDPVPGNNTAHRLVDVEGARPVLVATRTPGGGLAELLEASGLAVEAVDPGAVDWSLGRLGGHRGVILENVAASSLGRRAMERLAAWIEEAGGGLLMTGGKRSFGPGGYFESPIDPLLPVSMELRQEDRKFRLAMSLVLDRSGSMGMPAGAGRTKMDLAGLGAAKVSELLSPMDELGVIAVDSAPHEIAALRRIGEHGALGSRLRRLGAQGGGIFVHRGLEAALAMLRGARARTRHIILFADAADAERPGDYEALLAKCRQAGITVSAIGLGNAGDRDAGLLREIAERGEGSVYFTERADELPRLFAQDTFSVARSSFREGPVGVGTTPALEGVTGRRFPDPPALGGYNLCYIRDGARVGALTRDEKRAPVVAAWHAGVGRVAAYTGEADGAHTGPIGKWPKMGPLLTGLARWCAKRERELGAEMMVTQRLARGRCTVALHLPAERAARGLAGRPHVKVLSGDPGAEPETQRRPMRWASPSKLVAEIVLSGRETALGTVVVPGVGRKTLAPVRLPYSPELAPARPGRGAEALARLARTTAGRQRARLGGIWSDLEAVPQWVPIAPWLLLAASALLLAEVLERRTGLIALLGALFTRRRRTRAADEPAAQQTGRPDAAPGLLQRLTRRLPGARRRRKEPSSPGGGARPADEPTAPAADEAAPSEEGAAEPSGHRGLGDALEAARARASRRRGGK